MPVLKPATASTSSTRGCVEVREEASKALGQAGRSIRPALLKAVQSMPAPEKARRLRELLDATVAVMPPPEMLRPTRALEILERLGTPEARRLLQTLAGGNPNARLTTDAAAALRRLAREP
jgi:hypothetical protein